uniref:C-JID domain-containing protein n=1 Tax=Populus davidiana TaxID=266767 RepID=A0A6M2EE94_9ROSI
MVLPGSEIPEWFGDKGIGSSLTIQLPSNCHQLKGIALCLVFLLPLPPRDRSSVIVNYDFHVKYKNGGHDDVVVDSLDFFELSYDSDHMILFYSLELVNKLRKYSGNEVTFEFYHHEGYSNDCRRRPVELKSWGVYLHFDESTGVQIFTR